MENVAYEKLDDYTIIARKLIGRFAKHLINNDEAIGEVVSAIVKADLDWNPNYRSKKTNKVCSLRSLRTQRSRWAIQRYLKKNSNTHPTISLSYRLNKDDDTVQLSGMVEDHRIPNPCDILIERETKENQLQLLNHFLTSGIISKTQEKYIRAYYLDEKTLKEVGDMYEVSKEAVRQGIKLGIESIRKHL